MAITYPRALPAFVYAVEAQMRLVMGTTSARLRGGGVQTVEHSQPYWDVQWSTAPLTRAQKAELQAWWESLRGGLKSFLAYDPFNAFPNAYSSEAAVLALSRFGGGAFNGSFGLTTVAANELRSSASASRPPAALVLTQGDMISVTQAGRYSLHRVVETVTADASGNFGSTNAIAIEPAIATASFTGGTAVANVVRPLGEFIPDEARFAAPQTLNPSGAVIAGFSRVVI
jgi:hypothetical protein